MNYQKRGPRPLGGLSKPGAGAVMALAVEPPGGSLPLLVGLIGSAQGAAYVVVGGPDFQQNAGMIHEYNLLVSTPGYINGEWSPEAFDAARANKLATIAELIRSGWTDLNSFMTDATSVLLYAIQDLIEARSPGGQALAREIVNYYADQLTSLAPQLAQTAAMLETGGALVEDKIRGYAHDYKQRRIDLLEALKTAIALGVKAAGDAKDAMETPLKWGTVAIVGIAVVTLVGAAIYFIPRPRRR